jgi:bacteriocin-like protein
MAGNKLTIKLTDDQQNQIKKATGKSITELNIDIAATSALTEKELDHVSGGSTSLNFNKQ